MTAITWGIISGLTAFVTGTTSFLIIRFLLGAAEAGFFPGMILYFHRLVSFQVSRPGDLDTVCRAARRQCGCLDCVRRHSGHQIISARRQRAGNGFSLLRRSRPVLLGLVVLKVMTDRPARADWLTAEEQNWLQTRIDGENRTVESTAGRLTLWRALADPRVLALSAIYLMSVTANYGIVFFMPQIVKGIGLSNMTWSPSCRLSHTSSAPWALSLGASRPTEIKNAAGI